MTLEVIGIDHIYITVSDLRWSEAFYDDVMRLLGFRKGTDPIDGKPHFHYYNREFQYTLRPAEEGAGVYDPLAPGLHHICFQVADTSVVDAAARELRSLGVEVSEPRLYPEYAPDYYAFFFSDPDGITLEIVARTQTRKVIRDRWEELVEFENPVKKLGLDEVDKK